MSIPWKRALGFSMIVCLLAILAAPALAAAPVHGRPAFPASQRTGMGGMPGQGMHLLTSLQMMGFPVLGPLAVLSYVENAIQRFVIPSFRAHPVVFNGNLRSRAGSWGFNRSPPSMYPASRGTSGIRSLGFAENLTAYLGGKGYGVADLSAALSGAGTALQSSNMTAFGSAMRTFRTDLDAKITAGTMNRTVIGDYLKTLPAMNPVAWGRGIHGMGMRLHRRWMRIHGRHG